LAVKLRIGSLFSGIGLLDLGLIRAGVGEVVWQVEIDEFCRRVLARHWPDIRRFDDVRTVGANEPVRPDLICGGFPCQDLSLAGKRRGLAGERSGLWFEYARIIEELQPRAVIIENVLGLRTSGLSRVLADLAALGFDAEWTSFGACEVGAPHGRKRIWIVATHPDRIRVRHEPGWLSRACWEVATVTRGAVAELLAANSDSRRLGQPEEQLRPFPEAGHGSEGVAAANPDSLRRLESAREFADLSGWSRYCGWSFDPATRVDDGRARGLVGRQRKALGNGVVVRCAEVVGCALMDAIGEAA
jgi:DNA (cytosine-5)-methyltransferase 1